MLRPLLGLTLLLAIAPLAGAKHLSGEECFDEVSVDSTDARATVTYELAPYAGFNTIVIQRHVDSEWVTIATAEHPNSGSTSFDTTPGETYEVRVVGEPGDEFYECASDPVTFTAVPFFGGPLGIALAALGSVGVAAVFLRRK